MSEAIDAPLGVDVTENELVIKIGLGTLAFAHDHMEDNNPFDDGLNDFKQLFKVTDPAKFAREVAGALLAEEEDGSTLLTDLFDKACSAAVEDGCEGVEEVNLKGAACERK